MGGMQMSGMQMGGMQLPGMMGLGGEQAWRSHPCPCDAAVLCLHSCLANALSDSPHACHLVRAVGAGMDAASLGAGGVGGVMPGGMSALAGGFGLNPMAAGMMGLAGMGGMGGGLTGSASLAGGGTGNYGGMAGGGNYGAMAGMGGAAGMGSGGIGSGAGGAAGGSAGDAAYGRTQGGGRGNAGGQQQRYRPY